MSEREEDGMVLERREATEVCRCHGCGGDEPMACGSLCADCSWEDHLAGMAHTGDPFESETHASTPACCRASREEERGYFAAESERSGPMFSDREPMMEKLRNERRGS